jgi:hypothetical protein
MRSRREVVSGGAYTDDLATACPGFLDALATQPPRTRPRDTGCSAGAAIALSFACVLFAGVLIDLAELASGSYIRFVYKAKGACDQVMTSRYDALDEDSRMAGFGQTSSQRARQVWEAVTAAATLRVGLLPVRG